jgi:hypothetical protein
MSSSSRMGIMMEVVEMKNNHFTLRPQRNHRWRRRRRSHPAIVDHQDDVIHEDLHEDDNDEKAGKLPTRKMKMTALPKQRQGPLGYGEACSVLIITLLQPMLQLMQSIMRVIRWRNHC